MKPNQHFLRASVLLTSSLMFLIGVGSLQSAFATGSPKRTEAEQFVLDKVRDGEVADLADLGGESERQLRASFIDELLTNRDHHLEVHPHGVWIRNATISGEVDLIGQEIPNDVFCGLCIFQEDIDLTDSHFIKSLDLIDSTFVHSVDFSNATIGGDFKVQGCKFGSNEARFRGMRVGRDFQGEDCRFASAETTFQGMRVGGDGSLSGATFEGEVSFNGAHFNNLFFTRAHFEKASMLDFTRMQVDDLDFDSAIFNSHGRLELNEITFKSISPANVAALRPLLLGHDPEFHATMQTWFRNHGSPDAADEIFFADKRAERRERCTDFLRQCDRTAWAWSLTLDFLTGYGRRLDRLLFFGMIFLITGCFIFRKKEGMEIKNQKKDAPEYRGAYHPFWYSLDLFLPVVRLGEAEIWTPKYERKFAVFYKRLLMIVGGLIIPIALGALISK